MNTQNVGSLEASKKLVDNSIVLETDFVWRLGADGWKLLNKDWVTNMMSNTYESYPAPSFTDVWRELPDEYCKNASDPVRYKVFMSSQVGYHSSGKDGGIWIPYKGNPTDALIDLLVWLKGEGK